MTQIAGMKGLVVNPQGEIIEEQQNQDILQENSVMLLKKLLLGNMIVEQINMSFSPNRNVN